MVVENDAPRCAPFPSSNLVPLGRWRLARDRQHRRGKPGSILSGEYAPDSARAESSSIVDEPGECSTSVRENQMREPGGF